MKKNILLLSTLTTCAVFLMSATQCAQPAEEGRRLKKNVQVLQLSATTMMDDSGFKFSEVAKNQFSGVLFETNYFYERSVYPTAEELVVPDEKFFDVKSASVRSAAVHPMVVQMKKWFPETKSGELVFSGDAHCMMKRPQHYISGTINALEAYSGAALKLKLAAGVPLPLEASFKMDKMRMDLSFHAYNPWSRAEVAAKNTEEFKTDYKAGFGIDLGLIHIGPEFYRQVGLAELTLKALKKSVRELAETLFSKGEDWQTRIMVSGDNKVVILGGHELGLKNGDRLKVYNQILTWNGTACDPKAQLTGATVVSDTKDPWIIEIQDAGDLISSARVLNPKEDTSIEVGALVKLHMFTEQVQAEAAAAAAAAQKPAASQKP
ncbi:MAG: hypothetical protein H7061_04925 [Bdellovibrionaceae bacterium]|nr:hypothetical protein [Bdellovibrio sp.]